VTAVDGKQPAALIVEDDEQIAFLLRFIMEREGFQVHYAPDGRQARQLIDTLPPPAIVTLDVMLPYADGFQLLVDIRNKPGWQVLPVLMLTSKSQEKDIVRALELGANDYVVKPFKPEELRARMRRLVKVAP
jgi:DNA-binding response OmpR family regulator